MRDGSCGILSITLEKLVGYSLTSSMKTLLRFSNQTSFQYRLIEIHNGAFSTFSSIGVICAICNRSSMAPDERGEITNDFSLDWHESYASFFQQQNCLRPCYIETRMTEETAVGIIVEK